MEMTPRQLHALELLRHWRKEEEMAAMATLVRMAQHADADQFGAMIKRMT